jgi:hypothetical protein
VALFRLCPIGVRVCGSTLTIARLSLAPEFSDKLAMTDKFPVIFDKANDNIGRVVCNFE